SVGRSLVDAATHVSTVPGRFAAGECAAGLHGANRLGGNSLSDLLVFGQRAGEFAAQFAKQHRAGPVDREEVDAAARAALAPFERRADQDGGGGRSPSRPHRKAFMPAPGGSAGREGVWGRPWAGRSG